jgi:hypothetical protein
MQTILVDRQGTAEPLVIAPAIAWDSVIAGGVAAAATSSVLLTFGSAVGLSVVSTSSSWRDTSVFLWLVSGLYLVFVALASFGLGGYVAGRLSHRFAGSDAEIAFRDGMNGILAWGTAILFAALLAAAGVVLSSKALPAAGTASGPSAGETLLAAELDKLFRSDRSIGDPDWTARRAEASRILMTAGGHNGVARDDRDYLAATVRTRTGTDDADAGARTDRAIADAATAIANARHAAILEGFMIGAALLLGAAISWFAAEEGGREREAGRLPKWQWRLQHPFVRVQR